MNNCSKTLSDIKNVEKRISAFVDFIMSSNADKDVKFYAKGILYSVKYLNKLLK